MEDKLKKGQNESKLSYIKRITENKDILDLDYSEWSNLVCGKQYSSENARKAYYIIKPMLESLDEEMINNINDNDLIKELEEKTKEYEKEKVKFQDQKNQYRNFLRIDARWEHLEEEIIKAISRLNIERPLIDTYKSAININSNNEATLCCSDWHIGLEVENYWNKFNFDVARERVNKLTHKVISYCKDNQVKTLHIELLGDLVNGLIHISTRIYNEEDTINQIMVCAELLSEMINELSKHIENINVYSTVGNHGRVSANIKEHVETENFEKLIPWYLQARVQCKNVKFVKNEFDSELISYKVNGEYIFGLHGHHDKPLKVVDDWCKMLRLFPKEIHLGHWHKHYETEEYDILVSINGSLSGVDQFAKQIRKTNTPFQKLIIYKSGEEDSCSYRIKL